MDHAEARAKLTELGIFKPAKQVSLLHRATTQSVINTTNPAGTAVFIAYSHVTGYDAGYGWMYDGKVARVWPDTEQLPS